MASDDDLPSPNRTYVAIKNYLINELGVNATMVTSIIDSTVKRIVSEWFQKQIETRDSMLHKLLMERISFHAQAYLKQNLTVALAKVECKAEIMIVDGRMNEP